MKITIETEDLGAALALLSAAAEHEDLAYAVQPDTPEVERAPSDASGQPAQPTTMSMPGGVALTESHSAQARPGTAAALLNDPTQPGQGAPDALQKLNNPQPEQTPAEALIANCEAEGRKVVAAVNTKDSKRLKVGAECFTEDGPGVIAATYRGQAIVEFEDGAAGMYPSNTISSVPEGDTPEPKVEPGPEPEPEPAPQAASLNGAGAKIPEAQANALREMANSLCQAQLAHPNDIMTLLSNYDAKTFADLPDHAYEPMNAALKELHGANAEVSGFGF